MSFSYGGLIIKDFDFTNQWGLNPATGRISGFGGQPASDTPVNFTMGGATFNGIVTNTNTNSDTQAGDVVEVNFTDNRIFLQDDFVCGYWNGTDILADDPTTPGIDRKRRYWHILPQNWQSQVRTYTDQPLTAREICETVLRADSVSRKWSLQYTRSFSNPAFAIDALNGKRLDNLLGEIFDQIGVICRLEGSFTLAFAIKGDGVAPQPSSNSSQRSNGSARGYQTSISVIGDRNVVQVQQVDLAADWNSAYERFWLKPEWVREVADVFETPNTAAAAAVAREVTLRDYAVKKGESFLDASTWHDVSRSDLPVWKYLDEIVYKAYRIPASTLIQGVALQDTELHDTLLVGVNWAPGGTLSLDTETLYPSSQAFIIAQGAGEINLADPRFEDAFTADTVAEIRSLWSPINDFTIDPVTKTVYFASAVCKSGIGNEALYVKANTVETASNDIKDIIVPNASAKIMATSVRGSFAFKTGRYIFRAGSGDRQQFVNISGLSKHIAGTQELTYESGKKADDLAMLAAMKVNVTQRYLASGGFLRNGAAGTSLNGSIDRVTIMLRFTGGGEGDYLSEQIEYSKERGAPYFQPERDLQRRSKTEELFPGQRALSEETRLIRTIARLRSRNAGRPAGISTPGQAASKPLGNTDPQIIYVNSDSATSYPIGMPVTAKKVDGNLTMAADGAFKGCLVIANSFAKKDFPLPVATNGTVNCRIQGPFSKNSPIGITSGDDFARPSSGSRIGQVLSEYSGSEIVVAKIRLGSSSEDDVHAWQVIPTGAFTFRLRRGVVQAFGTQSVSPSNPNAVFTCPANGALWVWAAATITGAVGSETCSALSLASGASMPSSSAPNPDTGQLPSLSYCPLVYVTATSTGLDGSPIHFARTALTLDVNVKDYTCTTKIRTLTWKSLDGSTLA